TLTSISPTTVTTTATTTSTVISSTSVVAVTTITSIPPLTLEEVNTPTSNAQYHGDYSHAGFINSTGPITLTLYYKYSGFAPEAGSRHTIGSLGLTAYGQYIVISSWGPESSDWINEFSLSNPGSGEAVTTFDYSTWGAPIVGSGVVVGCGFGYIPFSSPNNYLWIDPSMYFPYCYNVVVYGDLIIGAGGDSMGAYTLSGGTVWQQSSLTGFIGSTSGTVATLPTVGASVVLVVMENPNVLMAFGVGNGTYLWSLSLGSDTVLEPPAYSSGLFYVPLNNGTLVAVSLSGRVVWSVNLGSAPTTPAIAYGVAYVGTAGGELIAINATTGTVAWYDSLSPITAPPIVSTNKIVYEGTMTGYIYAVNATNGKIISSYSTNGQSIVALALDNGYLIALDSSANIYVFNK
ncbi:PQQ-binding-like beta-propeller repeat protein, partial [Caldivirga sp.]|uniref:outer membrane protein assembly factor BamB family protein n=1 Tax=Caldivirga sp. TaxID=2080243 RepID=UPI003D1324D9